jgi:hypothetical protein
LQEATDLVFELRVATRIKCAPEGGGDVVSVTVFYHERCNAHEEAAIVGEEAKPGLEKGDLVAGGGNRTAVPSAGQIVINGGELLGEALSLEQWFEDRGGLGGGKRPSGGCGSELFGAEPGEFEIGAGAGDGGAGGGDGFEVGFGARGVLALPSHQTEGSEKLRVAFAAEVSDDEFAPGVLI